MIVSDLMPGVLRKLGGRADVSPPVAPLWIKDAVTELTESYPFEQLAVDGPVVQFSVNVNEYPITFFTNNNEYPSIIRSWFVSTTTNTNLTPTSTNNTTGRFLKYRTLPVLDVMSKIAGPPSKWSRNGKNFLIGSSPDQAYATQIKYQREHPWLCSLFDPIALQRQTVLMPQSWAILVEFLAAKIGAAELRMLDYANDYHNTLYGDPDFRKTGRGSPGLIFSRTSQYDRDGSNNERQVQMVVMKQCA